MPHSRISSEEIMRRGKQLYEQKIRHEVETEENIGKQIVINIETGKYDIDEDGAQASLRLMKADPGAALYGARIGYDAVYAVGGALMRTSSK